MWGSAPRPGRGPCPLHPIIRASPQEGYSFYHHSASALHTHLGLRPKPHASYLARSLFLLEAKLRKRCGGIPCFTGFSIRRRAAALTHVAALPFAAHPFPVCSQAARVGFWGSAPHRPPVTSHELVNSPRSAFPNRDALPFHMAQFSMRICCPCMSG